MEDWLSYWPSVVNAIARSVAIAEPVSTDGLLHGQRHEMGLTIAVVRPMVLPPYGPSRASGTITPEPQFDAMILSIFLGRRHKDGGRLGAHLACSCCFLHFSH